MEMMGLIQHSLLVELISIYLDSRTIDLKFTSVWFRAVLVIELNSTL